MHNRYKLFRTDDKYVLYDIDTMHFYRLPKEAGEKFSAMEPLEMENIIAAKLPAEEPAKIRKTTEAKVCKRLVLVISQKCNLDCRYCYADGGEYHEFKQAYMTKETAMASVEYFLEKFPEGISNIQFFGGEALMNFDLMEELCSWVTETFADKGLKKPNFTIVTNGTLIDQRAIDLFNQYQFSVTISLDGDKEINDTNRIFKTGTGSVHDSVVDAVERMNDGRKFPLFIEMTVTSAQVKDFEKNGMYPRTIEYLHSLEVDGIHLAPVIDRNNKELSACGGGSCTDSLNSFFDAYVKYGIDSLGTSKPIAIPKVFEAADMLRKHEKRTNFCTAGIIDFSVNTCGDIYPCFTFIGHEEFNMGNVYNPAEQISFNRVKEMVAENTVDTIDDCKDCWIKGICTNCVGGAYLNNGDISKPVTEMCGVVRAMTERLVIELSTNGISKRLHKRNSVENEMVRASNAI